MKKDKRGFAGTTILLLVFALVHPGIAAAHGTASGEDDPCIRQVGERVVHFNAYQPQYQVKEQYCTDIPKAGETFLVVDLVDPALRGEPIGMRIVKGRGTTKQKIRSWRMFDRVRIRTVCSEARSAWTRDCIRSRLRRRSRI